MFGPIRDDSGDGPRKIVGQFEPHHPRQSVVDPAASEINDQFDQNGAIETRHLRGHDGHDGDTTQRPRSRKRRIRTRDEDEAKTRKYCRN